MKTDITVAENRIKDLNTRQEILNASILDILKDKRKIDKYNMEYMYSEWCNNRSLILVIFARREYK